MDAWVRALVDLHAHNAPGGLSDAQIEIAVAERGKKFPELGRDDQYLSVNRVITDCRACIDKILTVPATETARRRQCLEALRLRTKRRAERTDAGEIMNALLEALVVAGWQSEEERAKYRRAAEIILHWKDYFVSYTRRGGRTFNEKFRGQLMSHLQSIPNKQEWMEQNLVARFVHEQLSREGLRGYFDTSLLRDGDYLDNQIREALERSFVLVQLLQQDSLRVPDAGVNWSFAEFEHFIEVAANDPLKRGTRLTILVDGDLDTVAPVEVDEDYVKRWIGFFRDNHVFWQSLSKIPKKADALRTWSRERAQAITERKKEIVDGAIDV